MRNMRGTGRALVAMTAGLVAVAGCSSSGGSGTSEYSVSEALSQLPPASVNEGALIVTGDLLRASEIAGLERPDNLEDGIDWFYNLTLGNPSADVDVPVFVPVGDMASAGAQTSGFEEFEDALAWSLIDIDWFVEASQPPTTFAMVNGDFDEEILDGLDDLGDGVFSFGSGDDFEQDIENRSPVDPLGRPIRFAEEDGRLAMSTSTAAVEQWLDGDGGSNLDDLEEVAEALDDAGAYSAVLHSPEKGFGIAGAQRALSPAQLEALTDEGRLPTEAFHSIGIGWSADDGDAVVTMVFAHDDADAAETNAEKFEALFADGANLGGLPLDEVYDLQDVTTDGALVIVSVMPTEGAPVAAAFQGLLSMDIPFVHL